MRLHVSVSLGPMLFPMAGGAPSKTVTRDEITDTGDNSVAAAPTFVVPRRHGCKAEANRSEESVARRVSRA